MIEIRFLKIIIKYFTITGEYITLGQFLKEESFISSGGQAKFYLQDNLVTLNGELEQRRGKKIFELCTYAGKGRIGLLWIGRLVSACRQGFKNNVQ